MVLFDVLRILFVTLHDILFPVLHKTLQGLVSLVSKDIVQSWLCHGPFHELMPGKHRITTDNDLSVLPLFTELFDKPFKQTAYICLFADTTRTQQGKNQALALGLEYEQRHIAVLSIIVVEQGKLLCPIGIGITVVNIEDYPRWLFLIRRDKVIDEQITYIPQLFMGNVVFKACHCRL